MCGETGDGAHQTEDKKETVRDMVISIFLNCSSEGGSATWHRCLLSMVFARQTLSTNPTGDVSCHASRRPSGMRQRGYDDGR
jgi:hypothetical protein